MQISPISQQNNRTQFGASFVYDKNGYLTKLVQKDAQHIENDTIELAKRFKRIGGNQKLEIINWDDTSYRDLKVDPQIVFNDMSILNRSNGKVLNLKVPVDYIWHNLLNALVEHNESFYRNDTHKASLISKIVEA